MSEKKGLKKLTGKQTLFVEYYCQSFNATQAATKAGYKGSYATLRSVGSENLAKPNIKAAIKERLSGLVMETDEVLVRLGKMAKSVDLSDYIEMKEEYFEIEGVVLSGGFKAYFDIDKFRKDGHGHLIKSITQTAHGIKVELHDQMAALVHVGKNLQLFTDKLKIEGDLDLNVKGYINFNPDDWDEDQNEDEG